MNKKLLQARKQNIRMYAIYRTISLDLIFYYAIEFLFLTEVKLMDASEVVLGSAFYGIFMVLLQIPISTIIDRIGTRKSTILGNVFNTLFILFILNTNNLKGLILAQFVSALCFSFKNISDKALLQYSIRNTRRKGNIYSKVEGIGVKNYYILNAVTSIFAGFLYVLNPYAPMICSLMFTVLATSISFGFKEIEDYKKDKKQESTVQEIKNYFIQLKQSIKFIINSTRLRSIFLYSGVVWGIFMLTLTSTYQSSLLLDIGASAQTITTIAAIIGIASAIGSERQLDFHKKFRNKSLTVILIIMTIAVIVSGIIGTMKLPYIISLIIIGICFIANGFAKGTYEVLITRYLSNFTNSKVLTQIFAVNEMSRNIFRAVISFFGAYLLGITNTANALIIVGVILAIITLALISYMKTRLGLKPEQYGENDIVKK